MTSHRGSAPDLIGTGAAWISFGSGHVVYLGVDHDSLGDVASLIARAIESHSKACCVPTLQWLARDTLRRLMGRESL